MDVNDTLIVPSRLSSIQAVEDALLYMPDNPLRDPFADVWTHMTSRFTKFQIATFGSFIFQQVCIISVVDCSRLGIRLGVRFSVL